MNKDCPFEAINELLTVIAGMHAIKSMLAPVEAQSWQTAYETLEQMSRVWIDDFSKQLLQCSTPSSKSELYLNIVSKISFAYDLIEQTNIDPIKKSNLSSMLRTIQDAARYYVDNNNEIILLQNANPDIKAKLIAYFGDMLV